MAAPPARRGLRRNQDLSGYSPIKPRKRFGQHFLHDHAVIEGIIRALAPGVNPAGRAPERLVEIGPGLGALTVPLLRAVGRLEVIELDRDIIPRLRAACEGVGELIVHQGDVLQFDFAALRGGEASPMLRLIGNLPYNISTPLLFQLLANAQHISDMHFMLQREVVNRMAAGAGEPDYGRLSVMVQYYCSVEPLFVVKPEAFRPPPAGGLGGGAAAAAPPTPGRGWRSAYFCSAGRAGVFAAP